MAPLAAAAVAFVAWGGTSVMAGAVVGATIGAVVGGVVAAVKGENILQGALTGAVIGGVTGAIGSAIGGAAGGAGSGTSTATTTSTTDMGFSASNTMAAQTGGELGKAAVINTGTNTAAQTGSQVAASTVAKEASMTLGEKALIGSTLAQTASGLLAEEAPSLDEQLATANAERKAKLATTIGEDVEVLQPKMEDLEADRRVAEATSRPAMTSEEFQNETMGAYRIVNTASSTIPQNGVLGAKPMVQAGV